MPSWIDRAEFTGRSDPQDNSRLLQTRHFYLDAARGLFSYINVYSELQRYKDELLGGLGFVSSQTEKHGVPKPENFSVSCEWKFSYDLRVVDRWGTTERIVDKPVYDPKKITVNYVAGDTGHPRLGYSGVVKHERVKETVAVPESYKLQSHHRHILVEASYPSKKRTHGPDLPFVVLRIEATDEEDPHFKTSSDYYTRYYNVDDESIRDYTGAERFFEQAMVSLYQNWSRNNRLPQVFQQRSL